MRKNHSLLAAVIGVAVIAGCTGGSDGAAEDGGFVLVSHNAGFAYALFIADAQNAESTLLRDLAIDACSTPQPAPSVTPVFTYLDVGATVTLTGGPAPIVLDRLDDGSTIDYYPGPLSPSDVPSDTTYDVALSGAGDVAPTTWSGALHVPPQIVVSAPSMTGPVSLGSGDLAVAWSPTGSSAVQISFSGAGGGGYCIVEDDGSFSVPAAHVAAMPTAGTITITNLDANLVTLNGRAVEMLGSTYVDTSFTRP